jgi:hypothetical protein
MSAPNVILDTMPALWCDDIARELIDIALYLAGADEAKKAATLEHLRAAALRSLIARGDLTEIDARDAANALADRLQDKIRDYESRSGRA